MTFRFDLLEPDKTQWDGDTTSYLTRPTGYGKEKRTCEGAERRAASSTRPPATSAQRPATIVHSARTPRVPPAHVSCGKPSVKQSAMGAHHPAEGRNARPRAH
eukprot:CAMPEP_0174727822 /NCGR_PEP_ID=MMETSP1094-20130205/50562_1 /TAXON_ID=156173 /ORGANISM="Chrysochromulina brevifilum, Strain UTEX LB 985" /LENGTH=102 /DNA_ID=CAMNT_0015929647 /DNA_START=334 /DNA_END=642 /DNA_ORIENTATION=-